MKHLLIVSHFFPPMGGGGVQRITKMVKYLESLQWRCTVVAGAAKDYWMQDESLQEEIPESTRVIRVRGWSGQRLLQSFGGKKNQSRSSSGFGLLRNLSRWFLLPDTYVGWKNAAVAAAARVIHDDQPDAMLSTSPPETNHLVALELKRKFKIPWISDFRDPWIGLHLMPAVTKWHENKQKTSERRVLQQSDLVVTTTRWLRDLLRESMQAPADGGEALEKRIHVVRNGYDAADFNTVEVTRPSREVLRLTHTGMLTLTRSAEPLFRGLRLCLDRHPDWSGKIELVFVGTRESRNEELAHRHGVEHHVVWRDYVPHAEAIRHMKEADVLVLIKHDEPRYEGLIPGKFYEYLGAERPILAVVPASEAAELVRELQCGIAVSPDDVPGIAAALERFYESKAAGQRLFVAGERARAFTRQEQVRNVAALLEQLVSRTGRE